MRNITRSSGAVATAAAASLLVLTLTGATNSSGRPAPDSAADKPTIVLVHGAWADGSSWAAVTENLQHKGFTVDVAANPLRGVKSDASYLGDYLATIPGPIVLVGHSYGGMVITNAATGNPNVKALVYINAYLPRQGDTVDQLTSEKPGSALDPNTTINVVPIRNADGTARTPTCTSSRAVPNLFAAGVSAQKAAVLAAGQRPLHPQRHRRSLAQHTGVADDPVLGPGRHRRPGHPAGGAAAHGDSSGGTHGQGQRTAPVDGVRPGRRHRPDPDRGSPQLTGTRAPGGQTAGAPAGPPRQLPRRSEADAGPRHRTHVQSRRRQTAVCRVRCGRQRDQNGAATGGPNSLAAAAHPAS